ncbi:MAG TPA: urate oxidase [Verrucomicrobiae bacterium]|jgi:urate oxidase|nr:urate oxidase [Verrucomicrobiae bacterium]
MKLLDHSYGKARVRVMKVIRRGAQHSVKELDVTIMLQGQFAASYTRADNRLVVATDTMKNTVNVLAHRLLGAETEPFGLALAEYFLKSHRQIAQVNIRLTERAWERINVHGRAHAHSFTASNGARAFAEVTATRRAAEVQSGIEDLLVLKTTASEFKGFARDAFTTLRETDDRVFCTKINAAWTYAKLPSSYARPNQKIVEALLKVFATTHSPSVQVTLFQMGEAALKAVAGISKISLALPNKHCLLIDLAPFGVVNRQELFVPTDEPHGQIEGTVAR